MCFNGVITVTLTFINNVDVNVMTCLHLVPSAFLFLSQDILVKGIQILMDFFPG